MSEETAEQRKARFDKSDAERKALKEKPEGGSPVEKREIVDLRSGGYALYSTEKEAQEQADYLNKFNRKNDPDSFVLVHEYYVRPCTISLEHGLIVHEPTLQATPGPNAAVSQKKPRKKKT